MSYTTIIIIAIVGIIIGYLLARRRKESLIFGQVKRKRENKQKILDFLQQNKRVANNDIEKMLGVSDATATRYLNELEKEQKIRQIGTTGKYVYYVLK
jgi:predicted HTH transcriptional regulator